MGEVHDILAKNIRVLMQSKPEKWGTLEKLVKANGGTNGTLGRMRAGVVDCKLSSLADLARVFEMKPWQLLVPNLDPKNPPTISRSMDLQQVNELRRQLDDIQRSIELRR